MLRETITRLKQGFRTMAYPTADAKLPLRFRGLPELPISCAATCAACVQACPTSALARDAGQLSVDLGKCLFCSECTLSCTDARIRFTTEHRLAATRREDLIVRGAPPVSLVTANETASKLFKRSFRIRQVSAAGCNACEADANVLSTLAWDMGRFGIEFVASPRHADALLVTGPVSQNMALALEKTWAATPAPKLIIASGACAIAGGPYIGLPQVLSGVDRMLPVDLYVPGCPPHPYTLLDALLRLLGWI